MKFTGHRIIIKVIVKHVAGVQGMGKVKPSSHFVHFSIY